MSAGFHSNVSVVSAYFLCATHFNAGKAPVWSTSFNLPSFGQCMAGTKVFFVDTTSLFDKKGIFQLKREIFRHRSKLRNFKATTPKEAADNGWQSYMKIEISLSMRITFSLVNKLRVGSN